MDKFELKKQINNLINEAIYEDVIYSDITSDLIISENRKSIGRIIAQEKGVLAGIKITEQVFKTIDPEIYFKCLKKDGDNFSSGTPLALIKGDAKALLKGERIALNFLQHLSGIATLTNKYVCKISSYKTKILDTRKTLPGWRYLEKYAVTVGGGYNHRINLKEMILIKDNHIQASSGIKEALSLVFKNKISKIKVEIEVENLEQLKESLNFPVDIIMLDNMDAGTLQKAVKLINGKCYSEASGGINLDNIEKIAKSGVDYISIGKITSQAPSIDIHMEFENK